MKRIYLAGLVCTLFATSIFHPVLAADSAKSLMQPHDAHRINHVGDIDVSPDGKWIAYQVTSSNVDKDLFPGDLYMVNRDGSTRIQLTHTEDSYESSPRFSPDGEYLAFLSARADGKSDDVDKGETLVLYDITKGDFEVVAQHCIPPLRWAPRSGRPSDVVLVSILFLMPEGQLLSVFGLHG